MIAWLKRLFEKAEPVLPAEPVTDERAVEIVLASLTERPGEWRLERIPIFGYALRHRSGDVTLHSDGVVVIDGHPENVCFGRPRLVWVFLRHPAVKRLIGKNERERQESLGRAIRKLGGGD